MQPKAALLAISTVLAACGGTTASQPPPDNPPPDAAPAIGPPPAPWADMAFDDRRTWMRQRVVPIMMGLFQEQDPERFGNFGCPTCHGADMLDREFDMPNPSLPTLYPTGSAEQQETVAAHREMATFMFQRVTPTMQTLLGQEAFDPETGDGFTCYFCHPRGEAAAPDEGG